MNRAARTLPAPLVALLAVVAVGSPLRAQQPRDPAELLRLETVLRRAMQRVAASTVRVETFGGYRRERSRDAAGDQLARPEPSKAKPELLAALFARIDPLEFAELWRQKGLRPKATPLEAEDLRQLGDAELDRLLREHQLDRYAPTAEDAAKPSPRRPAPRGFLEAQGATTGLVYSADGWILVSRFALAFDPSTILVTFDDGRTFHAQRHGEDTSRGLALIKIDAADLPVPSWSDPESIAVGQWAFALGRTFAPRGLPSVHAGVVSATERLFGRAVQVDAWTSPANYGGPVIDLRGRVLGLAVPLSPSGRDAGADWYDSGIGFAVTLADIAPLIERMKTGETLHRAWLGVSLDPAWLGPGALVTDVAVGSPGAQLGLFRGDRIESVDGVAVRNAFHLQTLVGSHLAGDDVDVGLRRDGEPRSARIALAAVPSGELESRSRSEETFELPWDGDQPAPEEGR